MRVREGDLLPVQIEPQRQTALDVQVVAFRQALELFQLISVLCLHVDHQIHRFVLNESGLTVAERLQLQFDGIRPLRFVRDEFEADLRLDRFLESDHDEVGTERVVYAEQRSQFLCVEDALGLVFCFDGGECISNLAFCFNGSCDSNLTFPSETNATHLAWRLLTGHIPADDMYTVRRKAISRCDLNFVEFRSI